MIDTIDTGMQYPPCLDVQCSRYPSARAAARGEAVALSDALRDAQTDKALAAAVGRLCACTDPERRRRLKIRLACLTPSALIDGSRSAANVTAHTGLLAFDIDADANPELSGRMPELRDLLVQRLPYVAYAALSVSGAGVWGLVPIAEPERHGKYFKALSEAWERDLDIVLDRSCRDVTRLRFLSPDPDARARPDVRPFPRPMLIDFPTAGRRSTRPRRADAVADLHTAERIASAAEAAGVDLTQGYERWLAVAFSLAGACGEAGREVWHRLSAMHPGYRHGTADAKYTDALGTGRGKHTLATLVGFARAEGLRWDRPDPAECFIDRT